MSEYTELLARLYEGVWNGANPDIADELVSSEYLVHDREIAEEMRGPELYKSLASGTRESFPDMEFTLEDTVEEGTKVAVRWTMTATHDGPLGDIEPTGKRVELSGVGINRFEDRKLIESWIQSDMLGLMRHLETE